MSTRRERAREACMSGYRRGRKGMVIFITSDKVIQSVLTGAVTAVVFSLNEGVATYVQRVIGPVLPVFVPVKIIAAVGAMIVFVLAYYADRHTDEWREYVREATGEEPAQDTDSEEDVAGEEKTA